MNDQIQCNDANRATLVERYALGGMRRKEKRAFKAHLQSCPFCARQLQENRKIVDELKGAAKDAGWSAKDIAEIDHLYARAGLSRGINWKLTLKIAVILTALVIIPFVWWANKPATKMALLVSLSRETEFLAGDNVSNADLQHAHALHLDGRDREAIAALQPLLQHLKAPTAKAKAERLLGLSYLFIEKPDSALLYLQKSLAESDGQSEQLCFYYIAQAHMMMGNKLGALAALKNGERSHPAMTEKMRQLHDRIQAL